jgi:hypothetical protein
MVTVKQTVKKIAEEKGIPIEDAAREIFVQSEIGQIRLLDPNRPTTFLKYLFSLYSGWYWLVVSVITIQISTIYILPNIPPFTWLMVFSGFLATFYLPGFSLIETLYPWKMDLKELERIGLSIGSSLILTPLIGYILNYTPWGIKINPLISTLSMLTLTLGLIAVYRKYKNYQLIHSSNNK